MYGSAYTCIIILASSRLDRCRPECVLKPSFRSSSFLSHPLDSSRMPRSSHFLFGLPAFRPPDRSFHCVTFFANMVRPNLAPAMPIAISFSLSFLQGALGLSVFWGLPFRSLVRLDIPCRYFNASLCSWTLVFRRIGRPNMSTAEVLVLLFIFPILGG